MKSSEFQVETGLAILGCASCSMSFAIPSHFMTERRRDHATFYCPSGHANVYKHKSDIELATDERNRAILAAERLENCISHKKALLRSKDYQVRHYKGEVTKMKRKVAL